MLPVVLGMVKGDDGSGEKATSHRSIRPALAPRVSAPARFLPVSHVTTSRLRGPSETMRAGRTSLPCATSFPYTDNAPRDRHQKHFVDARG